MTDVKDLVLGAEIRLYLTGVLATKVGPTAHHVVCGPPVAGAVAVVAIAAVGAAVRSTHPQHRGQVVAVDAG